MRQQNWPEFSDTQSQTRGTTGNGTESNEGVGARSQAGGKTTGCGVVAIDLI